MATDIHIKGLDQLNKFLEQLTPKIEANVMRGALRAGIKVVQAEAKVHAAVASGKLRDGLKISAKKRGSKIVASLKATGPHAYIAKWIEFGTAAHRIEGKNGGFLAIGDGFVKFVDHPGSRSRPFMRPALDAKSHDAVVASAEYIKKRLSTKHGIDTSDVIIGDE